MPSKDYNDKSGLAYFWLEENVGRVLLVALFASIGLWGLLLEDATKLSLIPRLARGMGPELAGIVIAAVTIEALAERRQEAERKRILISQLGSTYRDVTEMALIELRNREWLYDGSLSKAKLVEANLSGANFFWEPKEFWTNGVGTTFTMTYQPLLAHRRNRREVVLPGADLSGAILWKANLSGAILRGANLSGADLRGADLSGAFSLGVNLSGAILHKVNLSKAALSGADLSGADLLGANLSGATFFSANLSGADLSWANLENALFLENTQLRLVKNLKGAIMPGGIRLGSPEAGIAGPSFSEWEERYLAGNTASDTGQTEP